MVLVPAPIPDISTEPNDETGVSPNWSGAESTYEPDDRRGSDICWHLGICEGRGASEKLNCETNPNQSKLQCCNDLWLTAKQLVKANANFRGSQKWQLPGQSYPFPLGTLRASSHLSDEAFAEVAKCTERVPGTELVLYNDTIRRIYDLDPQTPSRGALLSQAINEIVFPIGCSLVLFATGTLSGYLKPLSPGFATKWLFRTALRGSHNISRAGAPGSRPRFLDQGVI
jgi:hypothetical protein